MKICVNSQTPVVRFKLSYENLLEKYGTLSDPLNVKELEEGVDYEFTPGGVTNMIFPSVKKMIQNGSISNAVWVALGVNSPPNVIVDDILISHVEIEENVLREYTWFKENLWNEIHGISNGKFTTDGFRAYAHYNWINARKMFDYIKDADIFYIQDFQLLLTGTFIGPPAPALLRWHVPLVPSVLSDLSKRIIIKGMESFDAVIVSTRRDLEGLVNSDFRGKAFQLYPYIDPGEWYPPAGNDEIDKLKEKIKLKDDEKLIVLVARMDRIKSQDVGIKALAILSKKIKCKLLLIGNGSFSSSQKGGLGYGKGASWRRELENISRELGVSDRVFFMGHSTQEELKAAYSLSSVVLLTSNIEGFGITVLEGWIHKKPVVVSSGAGASELVINGSNGYVFPAGDYEKAAEMILKAITGDPDKLGEYGYESARQCLIDVSVEREKAILDETSKQFRLEQ
ncbi:MAG: glycosyltransferase family 4 protein [Thermoplasmatales archaeon]